MLNLVENSNKSGIWVEAGRGNQIFNQFLGRTRYNQEIVRRIKFSSNPQAQSITTIVRKLWRSRPNSLAVSRSKHDHCQEILSILIRPRVWRTKKLMTLYNLNCPLLSSSKIYCQKRSSSINERVLPSWLSWWRSVAAVLRRKVLLIVKIKLQVYFFIL